MKTREKLDTLDCFLKHRTFLAYCTDIAVDAMAIGFPATLNADRTRVIRAPNIPFMENLPVCEALRQELGVPVFAEQDVTFALCFDMEKYHLPAVFTSAQGSETR